jgi:hypothetical protein
MFLESLSKNLGHGYVKKNLKERKLKTCQIVPTVELKLRVFIAWKANY